MSKLIGNNLRKHRRQMSADEINVVESIVHAQERWNVGDRHIADQMSNKGIAPAEVLDTLHSGKVIEVHRNQDLCVMMRKQFDIHAVCVVVVLATRWVVTSWKNNVGDHHSTLDMSKYKWNVDLTSELGAYVTV